MKKIISALSIITLLASVSYWLSTQRGAHSLETATHTPPLIVGTNVGYPPFIFTNPDGSITGFDAAVAAAIADELGRPLIIKDMAFDALLLALTQGSVDMIIGGLSITQARKATGLLIPYYGTTVTTLALFYQKESTLHGSTLAAAAEKQLTVCTQAGSVFEEILSYYPGITIKTVPDISDICIAVAQGHADLGLLDTDSVRALVRTQPVLAAHEITIPADQVIEGFGIGIAAANTTLRAQVHDALSRLTHDGVMAQLAALWFSKGD